MPVVVLSKICRSEEVFKKTSQESNMLLLVLSTRIALVECPGGDSVIVVDVMIMWSALQLSSIMSWSQAGVACA